MTRTEWTLIAAAIATVRAQYPADDTQAAEVLDHVAEALADAIHEHESTPPPRWIRRHPDAKPGDYLGWFDPAIFVANARRKHA